jgi:hypothetical protein
MEGENRRWRTVALLAIGFSLATVMFATPAASHVGGTVDHLWGHLKPKADARYFTKGQAEARYVNAGSAAGGSLSGTYPNPGIAPGAVGSAEIENGQIAGADHAANSVNSTVIVNGSVTSDDVGFNTLTLDDLGPNSVEGDELGGTRLATATVVVPGNTAENGNYVTRSVSVSCGLFEQMIGGGAGWLQEDGDDLELTVVASHPSGGGWFGRGGNDTAADSTFQVYAICL